MKNFELPEENTLKDIKDDDLRKYLKDLSIEYSILAKELKIRQLEQDEKRHKEEQKRLIDKLKVDYKFTKDTSNSITPINWEDVEDKVNKYDFLTQTGSVICVNPDGWIGIGLDYGSGNGGAFDVFTRTEEEFKIFNEVQSRKARFKTASKTEPK